MKNITFSIDFYGLVLHFGCTTILLLNLHGIQQWNHTILEVSESLKQKENDQSK